MARPRLFGALALAMAMSVARAPRAAPERVIERIVAVVDGQPIFASELVRRAAPKERALAQLRIPAWRRAALRQQLLYDVLRRLVEERLIADAAREQGIEVSDADVERALDEIARSQRLTRLELETAVMAHGLTSREYRRELRAELLSRRLFADWVRDRKQAPKTPEQWAKEQQRWLAELRRASFIELYLPR